MKKVLLVQPKSPFPSATVPIGLMYIDSYLRSNGVCSRILDLNKESMIYDEYYDLIGISAFTIYANAAKKLIPRFRTIFPDAKIGLGGRHFSCIPHEGRGADFVVQGEGEIVIKELCDNNFEVSNRIIKGKELETLDDIYIDDISLDSVYKGRTDSVTVLGSRGCVFNCLFCGDHSKRVRYHSPKYFVDFLERVAKRYTNNIFIADDIFTIDKKRTQEICELILNKGLKLKLKVFGHINAFDKPIYESMKKAGVYEVCFGIESADNNILKLINKNFKIEKAYDVIREVKKLNLKVHCMYMVGNIGETEHTINSTIKFSKEIGSDAQWVSYAIPLPGTEFYRVAKDYGTILDKSWSRYNNMNIVFIPKGLTERKLIELRCKFNE